MSKRALKKYLNDLTKEQLEDQVLELYERFKEVKEYYAFNFNPKEDKLLDEAKFKIGKEYFPIGKRKAKARRSVAQKLIKKYQTLGVDPQIIAEIMIYNIEIAQQFDSEKSVRQEAFFHSMFKSFSESCDYILLHFLKAEYYSRLKNIVSYSIDNQWLNSYSFDNKFNLFVDE